MSFPGGSNIGDMLPTGQLSIIPWRRAGVKYTNNEAYFDVIEEIDAILDKSGKNCVWLSHQDCCLDLVLVLSVRWCNDIVIFFRYNSVCRDPGCDWSLRQAHWDAWSHPVFYGWLVFSQLCAFCESVLVLCLSLCLHVIICCCCCCWFDKRILVSWTTWVSTRVCGSSAGRQSASCLSSRLMETSDSCRITSALKSKDRHQLSEFIGLESFIMCFWSTVNSCVAYCSKKKKHKISFLHLLLFQKRNKFMFSCLSLTEVVSVLGSYFSLVAIPVYVKQNISFLETGSCGRLDITIGPKQTMGKTVEALMVTIHMPKSVLSVNLTASQGSHTYDITTKVNSNILCSKREIEGDFWSNVSYNAQLFVQYYSFTAELLQL